MLAHYKSKEFKAYFENEFLEKFKYIIITNINQEVLDDISKSRLKILF